MPYDYYNYTANVRGYMLVKVSSPANTASWVDGETVNIGAPDGTPVTFRISSSRVTDTQPTGTVTSDIAPFSSVSSPRQHPSVGNAEWTTNSESVGYSPGIAFGSYASGDGSSLVLTGTQRDKIPSTDQFIVFDSNYTSSLTPGTIIYNTYHSFPSTATNFTASWQEISNTALSGIAVGNSFAQVIDDSNTKTIVYAFGGQNSAIAGDNNNYIFFFSATTNPSDASIMWMSPWFRQDQNKNYWLGDDSNSASAVPSPGGASITIPIAPGVSDGAATYDSTTHTIYFSGGSRKLYVGAAASASIWGYDQVYGWRVDGTTGLITGSAFLAGVMPMGRYKHEMFVANGFLYVVGGMTGTYPSTNMSAVTSTFHNHVHRALILSDGQLTDWQECLYEMPVSLTSYGTGSGLVDGASFIYPDKSLDTSRRFIHLIGGLKQYISGTSYVSRSSAQVWNAELNFIRGASKLPNENKLGVDPSWQGPAQGERATVGAQLGPSDIRPVLPMLDNVYQQLMISTLPSGSATLPDNRSPLVGYRPGLKGTEIFGTWRLVMAGAPGNFNPNGDSTTADWTAVTQSQVYLRQVRLEFLVDTTDGYSDLQFFNPARERLYKRSSSGLRGGRKLVSIVSGSAWWDSGVSYIYTHTQPEYGRTVGITSNSSSDDFAVFTQITGALATYLTGTPSWFLDPPAGEGMPGLPYIPMSSATFGESAQPLGITGTAGDMAAATVDQQLPIPADDTLPAYLSRIKAIRKTQDLYDEELNRLASGSYF